MSDVEATVPSGSVMVEAVVECGDLAAAARSLEALGLLLDTVSPADDPREMLYRATDGAVRLRRSAAPVATRIVVRSDDLAAGTHDVADGSVIEVRPRTPAVVVPESRPTLAFSVARQDRSEVGRAGMRYRDLLPDRWGGRFIASHITIPDGGEVADYVHFHRIRFQMIFVAAGWVEVVYEGQGPPFRMSAGDCVLQPPEIRHRVLRSSPGLEVIEVGCPAVHDTVADHHVTLPTPTSAPDRDFDGQRFVRHVAALAATDTTSRPGWSVRDTAIAQATGGLAGAVVATASGEYGLAEARWCHHGEFVQVVVLAGSAELTVAHDGSTTTRVLNPRDAVALPPGSVWTWKPAGDEDVEDEPLSMLEVSLPADAVRRAG